MNEKTYEKEWVKRLGLSLLFIICGLLVFVFGTNYYSLFPTNNSLAYKVGLAAVFLVASWLLRRSEGWRQFWQVAYAFFIAIFGYLITSLTVGIRDAILGTLNISMAASSGPALGKVFEALLAISSILILNRIAGGDLDSLFVRKGRLGLGLFVGLSLLVINTATGFVVGASLGHPGEKLLAMLPWSLLFSLANAFMEELWFRGLFLRKFAPIIGEKASILVTAFVFTVAHAAAMYMNPSQAVLFQIIIFPMALLFAYLMYKTDSVWGPTLYHAGSDVFLFYLIGW